MIIPEVFVNPNEAGGINYAMCLWGWEGVYRDSIYTKAQSVRIQGTLGCTLLGRFKGWKYCNWELFPKNRGGHAALVRQLKEIVTSKYNLKLDQLDEKEECIAWGRRDRPIFPHIPDVIISIGNKPEDRIFIEYVNTLGRYRQNYLRDLRGMLALSAVVKRGRGFVVATRDSIWKECYGPLHKDRAGSVEPMSLKSLLLALDNKDYDYLVGR